MRDEEFDERPKRRPRRDDDDPPEPPRRRRRDDDDFDERPRRPRRAAADDDDFDSAPRRRRDYEDDDDSDEYVERRRRGRKRRARDQVAGPALALKIVGWIGIVFANLVILSVTIQAVSGEMARGMRNNNAGYVVGYVIGTLLAPILSLVWAILLIKAGSAMSKLSGYGAAMTGCIVAMLPCNLGCLGGLPIGIWGLIVLSQEEVKRAFR